MLSLLDLHAQIDEALAINSIESSFSYEFYTDLINEQRSVSLRNEYNRNRSIDPYVLQSLNCLELEKVNPIDCCVDVPKGCSLMRTVMEIPNTIEFFFTKGIASIGSPDITKPRIVLIDYSRVPYVGEGRTTGKTVYAFLYNNHIYLTSKDINYTLLKYITVRGIFEDPTSLGAFLDCQSAKQCWSSSDIYPLNLWMWAYIKPLVLQQLMQKGVNQLDDSNNAEDQRTEQGAPTNGGQ
jgi:hypothetical protein